MPGYMSDQNPETDITSHREIYKGKIVKLHVDMVRLESGTEVIREVVRHPGGVVAAPFRDDGRLLLVRQFRYPIGKYLLELPAGKMEPDQEPLETIHREVEEEVGHRARTMDYQCSFYTSPGISSEIIHFYVAGKLEPVPQRLEEGEHITVEAYTLDECVEQVRTGEITDGKTILAVLWLKANFNVK
jgi:ADP-ribose pyrophosphatase